MDGRENVSLNPLSIIDSVINCRYIGIYYFFIIIFGIYLAIPLFASVPEESRKKVILYCSVVAVTVNSVLPFLFSMTGGAVNHNSSFVFPVCNGYLQYALIGYYLDNYKLSVKLRLLVYLIGALGFALIFFGTWFLSYRDNSINSLFKGYTNLPCVVYSSALFLLFKNFPFDKLPKFILNALTFFGGQTFGIYLIHIQLKTVAERCFNISAQGFFPRILYAVILFAVSGFAVKIIQKIPLLKNIVP